MKPALVLAVTLGVTGSLFQLSAQEAPGRGPGGGGQGGGPGGGGRGGGRGFSIPLVKSMDVDGDGALSAGEIADAPKGLKSLDKNSDGKLTNDELGSGFGGRGGGGGPGGPAGGFLQMFPAFTALDTDKDGSLSAGEIDKAPTTLLVLDKDKNGVVAADELRPVFGGPGGQRPRRVSTKPQRPPYEE